MKSKLLILVAFLIFGISVKAQNTINLVIFSEDGDPFYVFLNGIKQNNNAETNVKLSNIAPMLSLRIEFENKISPPIKQNMSLEAGREHTARIKRDKKNQLKIRYSGSVALNEIYTNTPTTEYHTAETTEGESNVEPSIAPASLTPVYNTSNISIQINIPNSTANVNRSSNPVSTGTSSYSTNDCTTGNEYSSSCRAAMSQSSFLKMKESVEAKNFSNTKMSTAKVATQNACLSVAQIKTLASLFSMDDDKLIYAKFAYDHCVDRANYYQVADVFKSSFTVDELNAFLQRGSQ